MPTVSKQLATSALEPVQYAGLRFYIKRDDCLNQHFSGNKARKFAYFLDHQFQQVTKIVGYGSAQANALYSLAALAKLKHWQLDYYCTPIAKWLKANPSGNYQGALALGANIIEVPHSNLATNLDDYMHQKFANKTNDDTTLFIPEGGRCQYAEYGVKQLAVELIEQAKQRQLTDVKVMLPSGTGTTALYLQKSFSELGSDIQVVTCACVGDENYLQQQFSSLCSERKYWPTILPTTKKYHFGKLYPELYLQWQQVNQETNIEFDLLYDPIGWQSFVNAINEQKLKGDFIYIHQGGLLGNISMEARYRRNNLN